MLGRLLTSLLNVTGFSMMALVFNLRPDWRVLVFSVGSAAATCLACGLVPALRAARASPHTANESAVAR